MILGGEADPERQAPLNEASEQGMDRVLEALYDPSDRKGNLADSSPAVSRWLGDIRKYFPSPVVQVMQKDALERLGITRMLLEPELLRSFEPNVHLVASLLSLAKALPDQTRATAREVVGQLVRRLEQKLGPSLVQTVQGAWNRSVRTRRPAFREIDWHQTIRANLRHYQPIHRTIVPQTLIGHPRRQRSMKEVVLLVDQSGSMAESVVYAGILGAVLASVKSVRTTFLAFDTEVADLTPHLHDPVELLFGVQLGGGTDIGRALSVARNYIARPAETTLVLITDLFDAGPPEALLPVCEELAGSGLTFVCLLALSDEGTPAYDHDLAHKLGRRGIPAFACTPERFPEMIAAAIQKRDIRAWAADKNH